jgi:hypothetical protein
MLAIVALVTAATLPVHGETLHNEPQLQFQSFLTRVPACNRSGEGTYCSYGRMQAPAYVGMLDTPEQLRQALNAVNFQKEIIMFAEGRITEAAHALSRFRELGGYGHLLPIMSTLEQCSHLVTVLRSNGSHSETKPGTQLSCGAYTW